MCSRDFEEVHFEQNLTADGLVQDLFSHIRKKKKHKRSRPHESRTYETNPKSQEQQTANPKDKISKAQPKLIDCHESNADKPNDVKESKKSRKNKYKHLALAARAMRESTSTGTCTVDNTVTMVTSSATTSDNMVSKNKTCLESGDTVTPGGQYSSVVTKTRRVQPKPAGLTKMSNLASPLTNIGGGTVKKTSRKNNVAGSRSVRKPNKRNKYKHLTTTECDIDITVRESDKSHTDASETLVHKKPAPNSDAQTACIGQVNSQQSDRDTNCREIRARKRKSDLAASECTSSATEQQRATPAKRKVPFNVNKLKDVIDQSPTPVDVFAGKRGKPLGLKERMEHQLKSARFRYLNEQLYTTSGADAYHMFQDDTAAFQVYHQGFQGQVAKWPENPLDKMVEYIKARPVASVVADFGCGDAKLAERVHQKVHSFDLVALNPRVTGCDMANVPLSAGSLDIAVFCLSLMGTNLVEYIMEAHRVLKKGAILLVAEVVSRFDDGVGSFVRKMAKLGFILLHKEEGNKMFVWLEFKKVKKIDKELVPTMELQPCVYKKR